jgi:hypothetical protein
MSPQLVPAPSCADDFGISPGLSMALCIGLTNLSAEGMTA